MNAALPLLAELDEKDQLLLKNIGHTGASQMTIILGSLGAVIILVFLFVYLFRKQLLRKHKRHHHHHRSLETATAEEPRSKRKKWRRLRREHRPLNPTLAQTHGLPPVRSPDQAPPGL